MTDGDIVDYIMSRMTDQSKSRRQVLRQLVQLGIIGSAKELRKNRYLDHSYRVAQ